MKSKTEQINDIIKAILREEDDDWECYVKFVPGKGWYLRSEQIRWYGDEGEFFGKNFKSAIAAAKNIYN